MAEGGGYIDISTIDNDPLLSEEAYEIQLLLPSFELNNIYKSLKDNISNDNRKAEVLANYIEIAFDNDEEINGNVFEVLSYWQTLNTTTRRPSVDSSNNVDTTLNTDVRTLNLCDGNEEDLEVEDLLEKHVQENFKSLQDIFVDADPEFLLNKAKEIAQKPEIFPEIIENLSERESYSKNMDAELTDSVDLITSVVPVPSLTEINNDYEDVVDLQEEIIQDHFISLMGIFEDADPDFLLSKAKEIAQEPETFPDVVVNLIEQNEYPKIDNNVGKLQEMQRKYLEEMDVEEFLQHIEDPVDLFYGITTKVSGLYCNNAEEQLKNDFPFHDSTVILSVLKSQNFHYLPTLKLLRNQPETQLIHRPPTENSDKNLDELFLKEFWFSLSEDKVVAVLEERKKTRRSLFEEAKNLDQLKECQCCFDDEVLEWDMTPCSNLETAHFFCNSCVKIFCAEEIGQGKIEFKCLQGECNSEYSIVDLKTILKPTVLSSWLKRKQVAEIAAAEISDLASCPHCDFSAIMPNKQDKIFKCLNQECLRISCRLCKEPNHVPQRCEEFRREKLVSSNSNYIFNEMSEAMVRECYNCKKRFIKEEGCNKISCSCGAMMCYVCKKPIQGYEHFNIGVCAQYSDSKTLHHQEAQTGAERAISSLDSNLNKVVPTVVV